VSEVDADRFKCNADECRNLAAEAVRGDEPSPKRLWSSEDEATLQRMQSAGSPWSGITKEPGRTQMSCESYVTMKNPKGLRLSGAF
jgi:hypothetical protein